MNINILYIDNMVVVQKVQDGPLEILITFQISNIKSCLFNEKQLRKYKTSFKTSNFVALAYSLKLRNV